MHDPRTLNQTHKAAVESGNRKAAEAVVQIMIREGWGYLSKTRQSKPT